MVDNKVDRRAELVAAATAIIAERGVEALRTRDAAARIGITHASLHYYFPTKRDLIRAVLEDVIGRQVVVPMVTRHEQLPAPQRLRMLLIEVAKQTREEPAHVVVLRELHRYADRDEAVRALLTPYLERWRGFLVGLLAAGQAAGELSDDVDPAAVASVIILLTLGLRLGWPLAPDLDQAVIDQLLRLLEKGKTP